MAKQSLIGRTLGNYRVVSLLGQGGMGAVYLAVNPTIESRVAIKILHRQFCRRSSVVERFVDEARAVNRVGHPGTIRIHDCDEQPGVGTYLVMEHLRGRTLRQELERRGMLCPEEVLPILDQVAGALAAVHRSSIIHRDLKPENIFLVEAADERQSRTVKLLDFGVAKLAEEQNRVSNPTLAGRVFGSPPYMSPEQCLDSKAVDPRSDIYALGATAYEMLCGRPPYDGTTLAEVVNLQATLPPPPPSALNPLVPQEIDQVLLRAIELDPDERFASVEAFGQAVRRAGDEAGLVDPDAPTMRNHAVGFRRLLARRLGLQASKASSATDGPQVDELVTTRKIPFCDDWQAAAAQEQQQKPAKSPRFDDPAPRAPDAWDDPTGPMPHTAPAIDRGSDADRAVERLWEGGDVQSEAALDPVPDAWDDLTGPRPAAPVSDEAQDDPSGPRPVLSSSSAEPVDASKNTGCEKTLKISNSYSGTLLPKPSSSASNGPSAPRGFLVHPEDMEDDGGDAASLRQVSGRAPLVWGVLVGAVALLLVMLLLFAAPGAAKEEPPTRETSSTSSGPLVEPLDPAPVEPTLASHRSGPHTEPLDD